MDESVTTGPHSFRPLRPWDARPNGRCRHCLLPANAHPIRYWAPSRALGDRSKAELSWAALQGSTTTASADLTPVPTDPETVLGEAERIINGPRRQDYGDARESFQKIATGWSVILDKEVDGTEVALCMAWLKVCRFLSANDRDSLVDLGGYTGLAARLVGVDE